jgi:cyclopropane-fatty-acyl-phospholipid synthase
MTIAINLGSHPLPHDRLEEALRHYPFAVRKALTFAAKLEHGQLDMFMPDGKHFSFKGQGKGPEAAMIIKDLNFARRLAGGDVGIAESYIAGEWDSPHLAKFIELFCVNQHLIARLMEGKPIIRFAQMIRHWLNRNTKSGSRRNIHAHYDLGNAFYASWLDKSMSYSSGLDLAKDHDLEASQLRKYRALADSLQLKPGMNVLEIGCGWGGFAEVAARDYGCKVTGLTISTQQYEFAKKRMFEAGLNEDVEIRMQDYRDTRGQFDAIASIEMFEAVGEEYWDTYFAQLNERLRPGGKAGLQIITIDEAIFPRYRREMDFIRRYVFPGGMLATPSRMLQLGLDHGLKLANDRAFGLDYAITLAHWRDSFRVAWPQITTLGFDERFRRIWEYYLAYCEGGFRAGTIDVHQMVFAKG